MKLTVSAGQGEQEIFFDPLEKKTLKDLLTGAGLPLETPCGGKGICGRCKVEADGTTVRACETVPDRDMKITVTVRETSVLMDAPLLEPEPYLEGLGLALDLGTTTVAAFLYDLQTGKCLGMSGAVNTQAVFGADVISRIRYAENDRKLLQLTGMIREQVYDLAAELCRKAGQREIREKQELSADGKQSRKGFQTSDIRYVSIAGNTVMQHIYAAMSPKTIGEAPFRPLSLFGEQILAEPVMYYCPCVSGYVGGDTTAGILSTGIADSEEICLLADLGTNCEFALGSRNGFLCCSAPAGPAFECASGGGTLRGSELIDLVAELLKSGAVDETGRFYPDRTGTDQKPAVTGKEVRDLQLAKAAVRGAIETMLRISGIPASKVVRVLAAGGFGSHLNIDNAFTIGMFPEEFRGRTESIGNSAGRGACMALREINRKKLSEIASLCRYEELSGSEIFTEEYIEAMEF